MLALLLDGLVVLPKFLLERKSFGCAFEESLRVLCSRAGQLFALALRWMLTAAVRTGLMLLCGALLFYCVILVSALPALLPCWRFLARHC